MARHIEEPSHVQAAGEPPKWIEEFVGHLNTADLADISIARMKSPAGWAEPGQVAEFDEYTLVLDGSMQIETREGTFSVAAGEAFFVERRHWVRYTTPAPTGAVYVAVCVPAFSPELVTRDP